MLPNTYQMLQNSDSGAWPSMVQLTHAFDDGLNNPCIDDCRCCLNGWKFLSTHRKRLGTRWRYEQIQHLAINYVEQHPYTGTALHVLRSTRRSYGCPVDRARICLQKRIAKGALISAIHGWLRHDTDELQYMYSILAGRRLSMFRLA